MYHLNLTVSAREDILWFRKFDQQRIISAIEAQLKFEPMKETQQRKRLRLNRLAEWEMRSGVYRVFYDTHTDDYAVDIVAVGYKQGNSLYIRGKEYHL